MRSSIQGKIRSWFLVVVLASIAFISPAAAVEAVVTGRVVDAEGTPVPDASIRLVPQPSARVLEASTDATGRFTISRVSSGASTLEIEATSYLPARKEVAVPVSGSLFVEIRLERSVFTEHVVVTGVVGKDIQSVPGGTAVVSLEDIESSLAHNLKDLVNFVPGVLAQPRFGAEESQVSIRGSGLRNNFHHRGTNLLINGIPYQDADGFGDFESLDLLAMERIEIWKGANALRYGGNTTGGAINFVTHDGGTAPPWGAIGEGGSYGLQKAQAAAAGALGSATYYVSASHTDLDGYRDHSAQDRDRVFANVRWALGADTALVADVSYADVVEELSGSLSRAEFEQDPRQAGDEQVAQDWGRRYHFGRMALGALHRLEDNEEIGVSIYGQQRDMIHPIFQVLDQDQRTLGGEVHYRRDGPAGSRLRRIVTGFSLQVGRTKERRYENDGGRPGDLTAQFDATAKNYGAYFEGELGLTPSLSLVLGGRADRAVRSFDDRFPSDGDRSDERTFSGVTPRIGVLWAAGADLQVFGNVTRSSEPPLLLEMTSFGAPGFLPLEAQDTWQYEVGSRGRLVGRLSWDVAAYFSSIRNEFINTSVQPFPGAPFTVPSYRNAERTRHMGLELGSDVTLLDRIAGRLSWRTAYTLSRFRFDDDPSFGSNDLPGAPRHLVRSEVRFQRPLGFWVAPAVDWSPSSFFVDSANTEKNDPYATLNIRGGYDWRGVGLYAQATNLTDRRYSASVVVDDALGRYYEPSNGRSYYAGLRWRSRRASP